MMVAMVYGNGGFVWVLYALFFMVVGGSFVHGDGGAWLHAHATFYGADQNPTSLGESLNEIIIK